MHSAENNNSYTDISTTTRLPYPKECILICFIKVIATFATKYIVFEPTYLLVYSIKGANSVLISTLYLSNPDCPF